MNTCILCELPHGDLYNNVCDHCIELCEHKNTEYQFPEPENNVPEDCYCLECGVQLPIPEPDYEV